MEGPPRSSTESPLPRSFGVSLWGSACLLRRFCIVYISIADLSLQASRSYRVGLQKGGDGSDANASRWFEESILDEAKWGQILPGLWSSSGAIWEDGRSPIVYWALWAGILFWMAGSRVFGVDRCDTNSSSLLSSSYPSPRPGKRIDPWSSPPMWRMLPWRARGPFLSVLKVWTMPKDLAQIYRPLRAAGPRGPGYSGLDQTRPSRRSPSS